MDYQTYRPMTVPSKTRRTFTRNTFAEHNYNYAHSSKTNYPPRKTNNNHVCSHYWDNPMTTTNSVNFRTNSHPPQDRSENYPFFQQNKIKSKHLIIRIIYHLMMIIYNQIILHRIPKNIADKERKNLIHIIEFFLQIQQIHEINKQYKYRNQIHKTQYSEILVEYEKGFHMTTGKIKIDPYATGHTLNEGTSYIPVNFQKSNGQPGGHLKPHDTRSTRLQELSIKNNSYFGNIHYDIHLDMKLDYTISRIFQEMSLSELETLHQLCELERTQILQSLALAVLKIPYAGYLLSGNRSNFLDYEGNILWFYTCTKKVSPLYIFEDKRCYKRIPIFYKNKVHFVDTLSRRTYFWDTAVPCGSENSHNVVQLNPDEDKYYLLTPYPTLM